MEHLSPKQKTAIMVSIVASMLFAALNQTIIGNIMPRIIAELQGLDYFQWVFTAYMLTSSVTAILVGKLSDLYGRKPFLLAGLFIFIVGSFLCGTSSDIFQLIAWRGLQGLGGGVVMSTSFTAVGDLFPPRERGRWQGVMSGVFGLASILGPTLGGYIVDHLDWHWCFWIFLPFGIMALILIWRLFPSVPKKEKTSVDYLGSLLLSAVIIPILLAFSWAGRDHDWDSPVIMGLFAGAASALAVFLLVERRAANPVLPLGLFKSSVFSLSNLVNFLTGVGMFGTIMYAPFFIQGVMGMSATKSSIMTMPLTLGMVASSVAAGQLITRTGKYKLIAVIGLAVMSAGMYLMSSLPASAPSWQLMLYMLVIGLGLGVSFPVFTLTVQNAVEYRHLGVATSTVQLFRQLGGTIGVSVMGTIMSTAMKNELADRFTGRPAGNIPLPPEAARKLAALKDPQILMDHGKLEQIRAALPEQATAIFDRLLSVLKEALATAIHHVFLAGCLVILASLAITFFIKEVPLRTSNRENTESGKTSGTSPSKSLREIEQS